jgi:hypothetical protein
MLTLFSISGEDESIDDVKDMVFEHVRRLKSTTSGINVKETIAIKLDREDLEELLSIPNTTNLVALFGVDKIDNTSTVIVMGLNNNDGLNKTSSGYLAKERWTKIFLKSNVILNRSNLDPVFP